MTRYHLFSIRPQYAQAIFAGVKKYELRRGVGRDIETGDIVIVYVSGHVKRIYGYFTVGRIIRGTPQQVWRAVTVGATGIGRDAWQYIEGSPRAMALEVKRPRVFPQQPSLQEIRRVFPSWNPPLSYVHLDPDHPVFRIFIRPLLEDSQDRL